MGLGLHMESNVFQIAVRWWKRKGIRFREKGNETKILYLARVNVTEPK